MVVMVIQFVVSIINLGLTCRSMCITIIGIMMSHVFFLVICQHHGFRRLWCRGVYYFCFVHFYDHVQIIINILSINCIQFI